MSVTDMVPDASDATGVGGLTTRLLRLMRRPMSLVLLMTLLAGGACLLGFVQAGREVADLTPPSMASSAPARVAIAAAARPASSAVMTSARVATSPPWPLWEYKLEEPVPARDPPLTPVNWRLLGATLNGGRWEMVVLRQGKAEPEYFKVGDKLPGGYVVRDINQETVTLAAGRRQIVLAYIGSR